MILFLMIIVDCFTSCQSQSNSNCDLLGSWIIEGGRITENYESAQPYSYNRITFSKDTLELASGFFYNTQGLDDDYPVGRYPFVYYGNKEKYKVSGDSLYIYSTPYTSWDSFKINCLESGGVELVGKKNRLSLSKEMAIDSSKECSIKYIKVHVDGGDLSVNRINYKVTYSDNAKLIYEEWDSETGSFKSEVLKLKPGTFKDICSAFDRIDLLKLKSLYTTEVSDFATYKLEVGLVGGKVIKTEIRGEDSPDELRLALIPVLYGHQILLYKGLTAKRWNEK